MTPVVPSTDAATRSPGPLAKAGWYLVFFGFPLGNTYVGMLLLLLDKAQQALARRRQRQGPADGLWQRGDVPVHPAVRRLSIFHWGLVATMAVSGVLSEFPVIALANALAFGLIWSVIARSAIRLPNDQPAWLQERLIPAFLAGSVLSSLFALYTYFVQHLKRAETLGTGSNGLGTLLIAVILVMLSRLATANRGRDRILYVATTVLAMLALLFSFSRGAWVGFAAAVGLFGVLWPKTRPYLIGLVVVALLVLSVSTDVRDRAATLLHFWDPRVSLSRIYIWQASVAMIRDHPILGVGAGVFPFVYERYRHPDAWELEVAFAHNIFLQVFAEFGALGLILFLLIFLELTRMAAVLARKGDAFDRALICAIAGIMVHQQVDCTIYSVSNAGAFWLLIGLTAGRFFAVVGNTPSLTRRSS